MMVPEPQSSHPAAVDKTAQQQVQLDRMRRLATGLLGLMACAFVGARLLQPRFPWLAYVAAFAEAAMVGALADWFAVTALFRAPLGLPIPHTAIIPRNKDRIGGSVADFLEHNFLTPEVIASELGPIDFTGIAAHWLEQPANSRAVALQLVRVAPAVLRMIEDEDVGRFLQDRLTSMLGGLHFGPLAADMLDVLVAEQQHEHLFNHLIAMIGVALENHKPLIRQKIHERSPRWVPKAVDERFFNSFLEELEEFLAQMQEPESDWRLRFRHAIDELVEKLRTSPEFEARIAAFLRQVIGHAVFRSYGEEVWRDLRHRLLTDLASEDSRTVARLDRGLQALGGALAQDQAVRRKLNAWMAAFATEVVVGRRRLIADLVRRVIQGWDAETVSRKFELYVGRDLQYIRINGTLVGGLVGLVLHIVSLAL